VSDVCRGQFEDHTAGCEFAEGTGASCTCPPDDLLAESFPRLSANVKRAITASLDRLRAEDGDDEAELQRALRFEGICRAALEEGEYFAYGVGLSNAYEEEVSRRLDA
jgi:hypothetical protein